MSDATTTLLTSMEEETLDDGWTRVSLGGAPHRTAIVNAVREHYNRLTGRERPTFEDLEDRITHKVTLIYGGTGTFGGGSIRATEGTLFSGPGGVIGMLPKRARRKGWRVDTDAVLDVLPGYCTNRAGKLVGQARAHFPELVRLTPARLLDLPSNSNSYSLCVFGTRRTPVDASSDAIWLFSNYLRGWGTDIAEGLLLIRPEFGISEFGSAYGQDLLRDDVGEVVEFKPISGSEAVELCNLDFDEAYARIFSRDLVAA